MVSETTQPPEEIETENAAAPEPIASAKNQPENALETFPPEKLISLKEYNDYQGKLRCLQTIKKHSRAETPQCQKLIKELESFLVDAIDGIHIDFDENQRDVFEELSSQMIVLEDIIVRLVIKGEAYERVMLDKHW